MAAILGAVCLLAGGYGIVSAYIKCVGTDELVSDLAADRRFREEVHDIAMGQMETSDGSTLNAALRDITAEGYDITGIVAELGHVPPPDDGWWEARNVPVCDRVRIANSDCPPGPMRSLPRFVAACVCEMRSKFGVRAPSPANVLLVEAWYNKICKDRHVRQGDANHHRQLVLNAFFSDTFDFRFATARRRAPRWLLLMRGEVTIPTSAASVC